MFTGIIQAKGCVLSNTLLHESNRLDVTNPFGQLELGESIAVNGVCLTVNSYDSSKMSFDLSKETLQCTTLSSLRNATEVNLERAMQASTRYGGHYVSCHVDQVIAVCGINRVDEYLEFELGPFDFKSLYYLIPKGSITVDGVSLTINSIVDERIKLMLIPHTLNQTTLNLLKVGQLVNIEFDYMAQIVAHQLEHAGILRK